jgi:hypothetical protein
MDAHTPTNPIAVHEAGYRVASKHFAVRLQPYKYRSGLRCGFGDVAVDDGTATFCEKAALVMLIGGIALQHFAPAESTHDNAQARELLYLRMWRQHDHGPFPQSAWNEFHITIAQMQAQAREFVAAHQAEIARTAVHLQPRSTLCEHSIK